MSDWIERMERRLAAGKDRDIALARRLKNGPLPYQTAELMDTMPDARAAVESLRAEGEVEAADQLATILDGVESTLKELWEAINEADPTENPYCPVCGSTNKNCGHP